MKRTILTILLALPALAFAQDTPAPETAPTDTAATVKKKKKKKAEAAPATGEKGAEAAPEAAKSEASPEELAAAAAKKAESANPVDFKSNDVWDNDIFDREDHKVLVIHERKFTKTGKFEIGLHGLASSASNFHNSYGGGVHGGYHFTEYLGIDFFANYTTSSFNSDGEQLQNFLTVFNFPSTKEFQSPELFTGLGVMWSPIYGKFAFFRSNIIYFDFFGTAGFSVLTTQSNRTPTTKQVHPGSLLGVGFRVFINKTFALRFDVRNNIYVSNFQATTGGTGTLVAEKVTRMAFQYGLGFSALLGGGE